MPTRCLILACGNTSRGDDGAAWRLVEMAAVAGLPPNVEVIAQQQWTPELAVDLSEAHSVLFVDCRLDAAPGSVTRTTVDAANSTTNCLSHHTDAAGLLRLTAELYDNRPKRADLLLIGGESLGYTDALSPVVEAALPQALTLLMEWVTECKKEQAGEEEMAWPI
jgi:hydrogenase maturation protease